MIATVTYKEPRRRSNSQFQELAPKEMCTLHLYHTMHSLINITEDNVKTSQPCKTSDKLADNNLHVLY